MSPRRHLSLDDHPRLPTAFALVVAVLLVTAPIYVLPNAGEPTYRHSVERVTAADVPSEADVLAYDDLSPEAQAAILDALEGDRTVRGEASRAPEFFYSDTTQLNRGIYYVQRGDVYYRVDTYAGGGFLAVGPFVKWGLAVLGVVVGAVGLVATPGRRRWLPALAGTFGGAVLLGVVSGGGSGFGWLLLVLAGTAGGLIAFGATARRRVALGVTALLALPVVVGLVAWVVGVLGFGGVGAFGIGLGLVPLFALTLVPFLVAVGHATDLLVRRSGAG